MQGFKLDRKTIFYCVCYAVVIVNLSLIIPFQLKKLFDIHSQTGDLKKKVGQFKVDLASQDILLAEKNQIKYVKIPEIKSQIIGSQDIFVVSAYISGKAKDNKIDVVEIVPQNAQDYKTISEGAYFLRPIKIRANAKFHDLVSFLNDLDNSEYFLEVKELKMHEMKPFHDIIMTVYALQKG